jgi:HAD superfamily hydrolase (TIGR01509 family)
MIPARHDQAGGVVFDCDGVLANTAGCWEDAFSGAARKFGLSLGQDQLAALRGAALVTAARRIAGWSPRPVALDDVLEALGEQLIQAIGSAQLKVIEGARELLEELHGMVRLGVASNSPRAVLLRVLACLDITGYFAAAISADDVARPKPAPDPYLAACEALWVDPQLSFAIEDSQIGVSSATAAGLAVIELASPALSTDHNGPGSTLRVSSLRDHRIRALILGSAAAATREPPATR